MKRGCSALGQWLRALEARSHRHVAIAALANKVVRIGWKVLTSGEDYRLYPASAQ
jgi:transposase